MMEGLEKGSALYKSLEKANKRSVLAETNDEARKCRKLARQSSTNLDGEAYEGGIANQLRGLEKVKINSGR